MLRLQDTHFNSVSRSNLQYIPSFFIFYRVSSCVPILSSFCAMDDVGNSSDLQRYGVILGSQVNTISNVLRANSLLALAFCMSSCLLVGCSTDIMEICGEDIDLIEISCTFSLLTYDSSLIQPNFLETCLTEYFFNFICPN